MNSKMLERMQHGKGFIAALDQSGGSTPKALRLYGVNEGAYKDETEMFDMVHAMRTRIIKSRSFSDEKILGAILFEMTMDREIDGIPTAQYLWEKKGIVPFLKIDKGLAEEKDGVQMLKPMPEVDALLEKAKKNGIFGTKERSVIKKANKEAIRAVVAQQFELARKVIDAGLVPIIEPEVDINIPDKAEAEVMLKELFLEHLKTLKDTDRVIFKLTIPSVDGFYSELMNDPKVVRVVALSGGYTREDSVEKLGRNPGLIASFSRALTEGLNVNHTDEEFDKLLGDSVDQIYQASIK